MPALSNDSFSEVIVNEMDFSVGESEIATSGKLTGPISTQFSYLPNLTEYPNLDVAAGAADLLPNSKDLTVILSAAAARFVKAV